MRLRAVFFDAGETLVHPHPSFPELFGSVVAGQGLEIDQSLIRGKAHLISDRFLQAAREGRLWTTSPERSKAFWLEVYRQFLAELGLQGDDGLGEILYGEFTTLSNYRAFPDVAPTLERLGAAGLGLGVISNFEAWLGRLLDSLGLAGRLDVIVISGVEGIEKPDPGIFRLALRRAGVDATESVYVGDSPTFDTEPAEVVGMQAVLLDRRERHPDHAGRRIVTLDELPEALGLEP